MANVDWISRWKDGRTAFHLTRPNAHLVTHFDRLELAAGARVFFPLCGKTLDIHWLRDRGFHVLGAELSELAITQLFDELGLVPEITQLGNLSHYSAERIDIYVGDIFDLEGDMLGGVDAVYDRAALVALPQDVRGRYAAHVMEACGRAAQLLLTYAYEDGAVQGPPFSVSREEIAKLYGAAYHVILLEEEPDSDIRGIAATDLVWLLTPR